MKTQSFKFLLLILLATSFQLHAEKISKRIYKSFPVSQVSKLEISNKYGNIQIDDNRKDSVVIDVVVWVEGTGSRAQRVLDNIEVNINSSGNTVSASTEFRNEFNNNNQNFSIDYLVSVPADRDLNVSQKYGSVNMNNLTGKGIFDIKYGDLRAKNLMSPQLTMDIAYSKATVEATKNLNLTIRYSKFNSGKGENLTVDSRYSGLVLGDCNDVTLDSKYDDFRFGTVNSLMANSMYTGYKIEKLISTLVLNNGYGDFSIGSVAANFKNIKVSSRYASIKLGIESGASYKLDGNVRYCDLKHPSGKLNRSKEDTSYEVHGAIGDAESPKSTVTIESSYGNVSLMR
ncbi:MAG: hypothetical protein M0Q53_12100 [Prolixibacteraceae bacterium]|jgi:hypothetical protein|nr:hypothetical protein [Prolixibacteraceae bacterium]